MTENTAKDSKSTNGDPTVGNTLSLLVSEVLFIILPLIVLAIVLTYQRKSFELFHTPEWSFISTIIFGQILLKIIAAALSSKDFQWQRIVFTAAFLIVLGIVPSLLILTLVLVSDTPSNTLAIAQLVLCFVSIILFFLLGGAGQYVITQQEHKRGRT
jgi:hypothetical protein